MREVRGADIAMIFQEPMTSLNPVFTIGDQISEAIVLHQHVGRKEAMVARDRVSSIGRHLRPRSAVSSSTPTR